MIEIFNEDCLEVMKRMEDNSIDAIVTDPPYGISFMNKKWDYNIPSVTIWQEALRILKPGGHMLVACGTRTQHRMACNIEDAGFEIRDIIIWAYGSGFPKSLDISKALDKELGEKREVVGINTNGAGNKPNGNSFDDDNYEWSKTVIHTTPSSPIAHTYNGYGTALKPAIEMFTLTRKPISEKNIALNVMKWGTGGINVDGCRISTQDNLNGGAYCQNSNRDISNCHTFAIGVTNKQFQQTTGRFPANLIHDGSDEVIALFPDTGKSGVAIQRNRDGDVHNTIYSPRKTLQQDDIGYEDSGSASRYFHSTMTPNDTSRDNAMQFSHSKHQFNYGSESNTSAARFFYTPKASKSERNQGLIGITNNHPTIKPLKLMQYLIRLIAPPTATILDPFMGSGTTGVATILEGYSFIGCEIDPHYHNIAQQRINHATQQTKLI